MRTFVPLAALLAISAVQASEQTYSIRTIAGTNYAGDGLPATSAVLVQPEGIAFDSTGTMYIADAADNRVRKVDASGRISTVAGDGTASVSGLNAPYDVCFDLAGNLYIADLGNARVRKVARDGAVTTFAGGGAIGADPLGGRLATQVQLIQPRNIAVDNRGTLYISDFGANRIYQVTANGMLTHFAGTGEAGISDDGLPATRSKLAGPAGIAVDVAGNVYVADSGNKRVRRISGGMMTTVRDASGRAAEFTTPTSVAVDRELNLYVADGSSIITRVRLDGTIGFVSFSAGVVALDPAGRLYAGAGRRVHRIENTTTVPVAGSGFGGFAGDGGPPSEWRFSGPSGVARDAAGDVGSSRVDLQACKLEYSIVSPK